MKKIRYFFVIIGLLIAGCTKYDSTINGDFWLKMGDGTIVKTSDIDFYDVSTHMIYLKKEQPYFQNYQDSMSVYVGNTEIYSCPFHALYLSSLPQGEYISTPNIFYEKDIIRISFCQIIDLNGKPQFSDHRDDKRIIAALKSSRLYHEGLRCEITSVNYSNGKAVLNIELSNPDTFDYYYLDPDKMGIGLFHYFTNGLYIWDELYTKSFTHKETVIHTDRTWKKEWLSLIKSGQRKKISITYNHFDQIPAGKYKMFFQFPGLSHITPKDRILNGGRIWMGDICTEKEVAIK